MRHILFGYFATQAYTQLPFLFVVVVIVVVIVIVMIMLFSLCVYFFFICRCNRYESLFPKHKDFNIHIIYIMCVTLKEKTFLSNYRFSNAIETVRKKTEFNFKQVNRKTIAKFLSQKKSFDRVIE